MSRPAFRFGIETPGVTQALETGSQVYGEPTPKSDWDIVLLCSGDDVVESISAALGGDDGKGYADVSVRDGDANYILTVSAPRFEAWRRATERCLAEAPVARKRALEIHSEERRKSGAWS